MRVCATDGRFWWHRCTDSSARFSLKPAKDLRKNTLKGKASETDATTPDYRPEKRPFWRLEDLSTNDTKLHESGVAFSLCEKIWEKVATECNPPKPFILLSVIFLFFQKDFSILQLEISCSIVKSESPNDLSAKGLKTCNVGYSVWLRLCRAKPFVVKKPLCSQCPLRWNLSLSWNSWLKKRFQDVTTNSH